MSARKYSSPGVVLFLLMSVVTHLADLVLTAYASYWLYDTGQTVWMALVTGFLTVPLLAVQLTSWQLHSMHSTASKKQLTGCDVGVVLWHVIQLGIVWRCFRLAFSARELNGNGKKNKSDQSNSNSRWFKELRELLLLRCSLVFFSTLLVISLETYLILTLNAQSRYSGRTLWPLFASTAVSLMTTAWVLATFSYSHCSVGSSGWPEVLIKCVWRLGEVAGRILVLCLFASCHRWWTFLVLAFHICTMMALNVLESILHGTDIRAWWDVFLKPYISLFCFFSAGFRKTKYGFALYYTVTSLESVTLLVLWLVYDTDVQLHLELTLVVTVSYTTGMVCAVIYYNCFHRTEPDTSPRGKDAKNGVQPCVSCRTRLKSKSSGANQNMRHIRRPYLPAQQLRVDDVTYPHCLDKLAPGVTGHRMAHQPRVTHTTAKHSEGGCELQTSHPLVKHVHREEQVDFIWDDYDMKEIPEYDNRAMQITDGDVVELSQLYSVGVDNGYYSGISSSSNNDPQNCADGVQNDCELGRMATGSGGGLGLHPQNNHLELPSSFVSDNSSTGVISTVSSRVPILNCQHCGHTMSLDSSSLCSGTTVTSLASSRQGAARAVWRQKRKRTTRRSSMPNEHFRGGEQPQNLQPDPAVTSENTAESSVWEPTSDSEV